MEIVISIAAEIAKCLVGQCLKSFVSVLQRHSKYEEKSKDVAGC